MSSIQFPPYRAFSAPALHATGPGLDRVDERMGSVWGRSGALSIGIRIVPFSYSGGPCVASAALLGVSRLSFCPFPRRWFVNFIDEVV
jgi:hypothetical protein